LKQWLAFPVAAFSRGTGILLADIKESWLDRLIPFREPSLRRVVREFVPHYHEERSPQGLGNVLIPC
jgi:hypothetical protein